MHVMLRIRLQGYDGVGRLGTEVSNLPTKIIAGPILRRTEAHSVTVWIALDVSSTVRLRVYPLGATAGGWQGDGTQNATRPK